MIDRRRCATLLLLTLGWLPVSAAAGDVRIEYSEPLESLSFSLPHGEVRKLGVLPATGMRFNAFSRRFDIELQPNHVLIDAVRRQNLGADVQIYRGALAARPNSWARIVVVDGLPRGLLFDGAELYAMEVTAGPDLATGRRTIIYRLADLHIEQGTLMCAEASNVKTGADLFKLVTTESALAVSRAPGASSQIDLAVIADSEFANAKGDNSEMELITRMNNVDGIFSAQLGVQINVGRIDSFSTSDDPFSDETDSGSLLGELADYRADNAAQRANGLTHLFTGRDLDGSTVGTAFTGWLCSARLGVGLTQGTHSATSDSLIAAHELGHNFGAPHDGTSGSTCEATAQDFIMAPRLNGSDTFSACSITQMQDNVARAPCITLRAGSDVTVVAGSMPSAVLLGNSTAVTFDVTSTGTQEVTGVALSISVPAGLQLDSSSTTVGSCSNGAGTVNCAIGTLAGGSGATVTLNVTSLAVGSSVIVTTASANADSDSDNNVATVPLTVSPAIDLVSTAQGPATLQLNQSMTLQLQVENRSSLAANNASINIAASAGLRLDAASWPAGSCTVSGGEADCAGIMLAANSTATIEVQLTATAEGRQIYTVSATASEQDRDASNNESSGQVDVPVSGVAAGAGDDGGGGAMGLASLLFMLVVFAWREHHVSTRMRVPTNSI